jgi:hypothetical protein
MLKEIFFLLAGLAAVNGLGQQQCLYFPESHADNSANVNQAVFDARHSTNDFLFVSTAEGLNGGHHKVPILTSSRDNIAIHLAVASLVLDFEKVTGHRLDVYNDTLPHGTQRAVIIGTSKSQVVKDLRGYQGVVDDLEGKWESFDIRGLENPTDDLKEVVVVSGSDRVSELSHGVLWMTKLMSVERHCIRPLRPF